MKFSVQNEALRTFQLCRMESAPSEFDADPESFLRLLAAHERWLATYIYSLVAPSHDAEDVLQEIKITLWKHFPKFQPGSNFKAWARTIATHQVLNYRRSVKRHAGSSLDEVFIEAVAAEIDRQSEELDGKADALRLCVRKLPSAHQKMIQWRYYDECTVDEISARTSRSVEAVYRLLSRIRAVLNECVQNQISKQGAR